MDQNVTVKPYRYRDCPFAMCGDHISSCRHIECGWWIGNLENGHCAVVHIAEGLNGPFEVFTENLDFLKLAKHANRREAK